MINVEKKSCQSLVLAHTRELAIQIHLEFKRLSFENNFEVNYFLGGEPVEKQVREIRDNQPLIAVGTPGRILFLSVNYHLKIGMASFLVLDECDKTLGSIDMMNQVQGIFRQMQYNKQVMMFSATIPDAIRPICRKYTKEPVE